MIKHSLTVAKEEKILKSVTGSVMSIIEQYLAKGIIHLTNALIHIANVSKLTFFFL